jgi:hypothetical protein
MNARLLKRYGDLFARKPTGNKHIAIAFLCFALSSCQNEGRWHPKADVAINGHVEYTDPISQVKAIQITLVIHNSGNTLITTSAVTVQVRTNKREYLQTAAYDTRIIPGGKIAVNLTVPYLENNEALAPGGAVVYDAFFD